MEKPKLDVLRFDAGDVVVASGGTPVYTLSVSKSFNGTANDLAIGFLSVTYKNYNKSALSDTLYEHDLTGYTDQMYVESTNFLIWFGTDEDYGMVTDEGAASGLGLRNVDGTYKWDGTSSMWRKQQ